MIILKFKILVAMWNLKPYQQTFCIQKLLAYRIVKKKKKKYMYLRSRLSKNII